MTDEADPRHSPTPLPAPPEPTLPMEMKWEPLYEEAQAQMDVYEATVKRRVEEFFGYDANGSPCH